MTDVDLCVIDSENPWPGLEAFTEAAQAFFYGRDEEVIELVRRTKAQTLTVVFGQSGLGKTSLLRAGLFPRLRTDAFFPIYLRLTFAAGAPPPWDQVTARTAEAIAEAKLDATYPLGEGATLWTWLHRRDGDLCDLRGSEVIPVFVFDQFEELFTLGRARGSEVVDEFVAALGDLIESRPPDELQEALERDPEQAFELDFRRVAYRVLISLREDFLSDLETLRLGIPSLMQNRMRLGRMTGTNAVHAVTRPAADLVTPEVGEAIVRFVAGDPSGALERLEVEPSLLSLVCHELNVQRRQAGEAHITSSMLAGSRDSILQAFYEKVLRPHPAAVRAFVEDELVTDSGYRESMAMERARKVLAARGAPPDAIDELVRSRLLRVETRLGVPRVELTHDILSAVVCESRTRRRAREEKEALERAQRESEARAEQSRLALRAERRRSMLFGTFAVVAMVAAVTAILAWQDARAQRSVAAAQRSTMEQGRRRYYGAQAALSFRAWEDGNIGKARQLLADTRGADTSNGAGPDLRGWEWYFVHGLCDLTDAGNLAITNLKGVVSSLAVVPGYGGPLIAAAVVGGTVSMRDLHSGQQVAELQRGDSDDVGSIAASPDGKTLAYGGINGHVVVWEVAGETIVSDTDVNGFVTSLEFNPAGDELALTVLEGVTTSNEPDLRLVRREGGPIRRLSTGHSKVGAFAFSPDGRFIAIAKDNGKVTFRDEAGEKEFPINDLGDRKVTRLSFSPDGNLLAAVASGSVRLIEVASPATQRLLAKDQPYATAFAFSHDGRYIATTGDNGAVYVWDTSGKQERVLRGHLASGSAVAFGPEDQVLVTAANDTTIRVWDLHWHTPKKFREFHPDNRIKGLSVSADGSYLAATVPYAKEPGVVIFDATTGRELRRVPGKVFRTSFAPDRPVLAVPGAGGGVELVDVTNGKTLRSLAGLKVGLKAVEFTADGRFLVTVPEYDEREGPFAVRLWNVETGESRRLPALEWCDGMDLSPDGRLLVAVSATSEQIDFFRMPMGTPAGHIQVRSTTFVRFSPDGKLLLSAGDRGAMTLWRVADRQVDGELQGTASLLDAVFSHDGRWLVTASADRTIRFWDVAARRELFVMDDSAKTDALTFSRAEDRLFSGGGRQLRFWDAALLAMHPEHPTTVFQRARGSYLASLNQWEQAVADYTGALVTGGPDAVVFDGRGEAYAHLGRWGDAVSDFDQAVKLASREKGFLDHLAVAALKLGRRDVYESARAELIRMAKETTTPDVINSAVWVTSLASRPAGTVRNEIALQRRAVRDSPTDYAIASTLGTILAREGDPDEAVRALNKAMTLAEDKNVQGSAFDWISLAFAHIRAGRLDEAAKWLKKVADHSGRLRSDPFYDDPNWSWDTWNDVVELEALQRDAKALFDEKTAELHSSGRADAATSSGTAR